MGRDTSKIEENTNVKEEKVQTQVITENQLINMKLDSIINLLNSITTSKEPEVKEDKESSN